MARAKQSAVASSPPAGAGKSLATQMPSGAQLDELIRRRAYEIYAGRGGRPAEPIADWLEAEREIRAHYGMGERGMRGEDRFGRGDPEC